MKFYIITGRHFLDMNFVPIDANISLNPEDILEVENDRIHKIPAKENMLHIKRSKEEAKLADT